VGKKCACYIKRSGKGNISRLTGIPFTIAEPGKSQKGNSAEGKGKTPPKKELARDS
jgi:hypothetical protein